MTFDIKGIVETLQRVTAPAEGFVALHEPRFAGREWDCVKACLDSGWVSSAGAYVSEFETRLAQICGVGHAVAVVNGTAALHLAMIVAGVRPGDEVIIPALTFAATANAVSHAGAVPHLADSEPVSLGIDADKLDRYLAEIGRSREGGLFNSASGRRISAIVPMHVFGHPVEMDRLAEVAARFGLPVIEDAAEALGSSYRGRPAGSLGRLAALSFNGNKIVTTGGGGAVLTDDEALARRARHLSTTAKLAHAWEFDHDEVGYNYRMPNINAALGVAQLDQLAGFVDAKRKLAERYFAAFEGVTGVNVLREPGYGRSNYWLNALVLDHHVMDQRDRILEATNAAGLMTRPVWKLMHRLPMYATCPRMGLDVAEDLERRVINVPSSAVLGMSHVSAA